jgi:dTDP-glucose 4,6-dehydratase
MPELFAEDLDHVLSLTKGLWDGLRGGRLFVTGGTGFFGCWLLETFTHAVDRLGLGATAVVLTRNPVAFARKAPHLAAHPAVTLHRGDVRDFDFPTGDFSHVIHAATESGTTLNADAPGEMLDTILRGTRRVLDFARKARTRQLLLTSSGAVYGQQPPQLTQIPEDYPGGPDPCDPRSAYAEGKRVAELLCLLESQPTGPECKIARSFAFVGPHLPLDAHFAIGNFLRDALAGGPIRVRGDGTPYRSYLYAADLAAWLWTILFRGRPGRPYNVGSANGFPIAEVAHRVADSVQPSLPVAIARRPEPGKLPECYVPCVNRAAEELGLRERIGLEDAIRRTLRWYQLASAAPGISPSSHLTETLP